MGGGSGEGLIALFDEGLDEFVFELFFGLVGGEWG